MTVTFSLAFMTSRRSSAGVEGLGVQLAVVTGETENLDGGLEDAVEEGVVGRPFGLEAGDSAGDFRERNGEMVEGLWDLEMLVDDAIYGVETSKQEEEEEKEQRKMGRNAKGD